MGRWRSVAPIWTGYRHGRSLVRPFQFGSGVWLGDRLNWSVHEDDTKVLSDKQRREVEQARLALVAEYDASSLGDPDLSWKGKGTPTKQDVALERLRLANVALWLALPSSLGFEICIHQEDYGERGEFRLRQALTFERVRALPAYQNNSLSNAALARAKRLFAALASLSRDSSVWTSVRMLLKALVDRAWETRFPLLWISIEALLGPDESGEVTYRLSNRSAFFLGRTLPQAEEIATIVKEGYGWRSKAVHGMKVRRLTEEKAQRLLFEAESVTRGGLTKVLNSRELIKTFSSKNRDSYLDRLPFSRGRRRSSAARRPTAS